ncbi:MAG: uroporphyrinogen decarboxylase family protein [Clostridiales bacterium]|nr:uroporphyrinogen decarboxylase family protein [Clostridiales bacterium]
MTPYERIHTQLQGKPVDKVPNLNILMAFAAEFINVSFDKFCLDYRYLVEANIKCNEYFGIDMLNTMSDAFRETYDFGAEIKFPYDNLPISKIHFIQGPEDIKKLKIFDPLNSTRILDRIRAVELFKKETGNNYSILGWVEGSFAEAADLRGVSEIMYDLYDEPEFVKDMMSICCEEGIMCAKEQIKAGADFIGVGDAVASLISPALYREFVLPFEQKLFKEIHDAGAKVKLHICGNISNILDDIWQSGADIIDIDFMVDFKTAIQKFKGHPACANGNFDPVRTLKNGTPESIRQAVMDCLSVADERTFISAGCEVPKNTPYENLKAVDDALKMQYNTSF